MILTYVGKSGGKSTNAVNVSCALAEMDAPGPPPRRRRRVRLVNADPLRSVMEWAAQRTTPPLVDVIERISPRLHLMIDELHDGFDDLVFDTPGGTGQPFPLPDGRIRISRSAILAALQHDHGVVVIPQSPSPWDLWAGDDLLGVLEEAWTDPGAAPRARSRTVLLLNRVSTKGITGTNPDRVPKIVRAARARLEQAPAALLSTVIYQRDQYLEAPNQGQGVTEYAPRSAAAVETRAQAAELLTVSGERKN